ncbi:MAG: glycosyl hydrolase 53 family protein [Acidobacteriaceae bacterium]|nr:glycosyl hydrolase 53 family protein [Acidobacteriaceae bacterium]
MSAGLAIAQASPAPQGTAPANPLGACPPIALGADVSFAPQAEQQGTVFTDHGVARPLLETLRQHGYGWVRLRLFNNPTTLPNNLEYTLAEAKKAKALGFGLVLDLHYSDDWGDPQHQITPLAWQKMKHEELTNAVFTYTRDTIARFREEGVMPDIVQTGNEITSGMMWPDGKLPDQWPHMIELLSAAGRGVVAGTGNARRPSIMLHIDQGGNIETTRWFFSHILAAHVPFDVIGQSYYPWWEGSLADLKANLAFMANEYHKPIVVIETAYSWRPDNYIGKKAPYPETPEGQREFLQAVAQTVAETPNHLGRGLFWWEPAVRGPLARRGLFDDDGKSLPALNVFDACMQPVSPKAQP